MKFKKGQSGNAAGSSKKSRELKVVRNKEFLRNIDKQRELDRILRITPAQLKEELNDPNRDIFSQMLGRWTYNSLTSKKPEHTQNYIEHVFGKPKETFKLEASTTLNVEYKKIFEIRQILKDDPFLNAKEVTNEQPIQQIAEATRGNDDNSDQAGSREERFDRDSEDPSGSEQT